MEHQDQNIINLKTISRLFHELAFNKENTRLSQKTLQLSAQYINLFIREGILRSNDERLSDGDRLSHVDGIDNLETIRGNEGEEVEEEVPDITLNEDDIQSNPNTQYTSNEPPADGDNDTLDVRHLSKIAGVLLLDF
ncbi:hypothetical protein PSN45_003024 [Yamadazyma tenuis]|uniref:Uncharacterized protein n=1 Tax=Candida tenuis (strain ATCC 10573 / BCRC 21748 / CBS 615 / JCM 9827 / NBRC 10315 / NRRL Y-1498 / VKM Y-70) TaxID=590646 RepID=G3AXH2_CANTC|nr:uncharacterized protein CANTEDRAFT_91540 [Yamadazyma tenuis ATCC 10573]EGV66378.1 hypothetical protein CANTEDRAFT_91540 [Yamadazyma tenuis ATCC 10573]WEJ95504.1 hypothetical protein PSN45_003024 [Yamadazyma tenuis]